MLSTPIASTSPRPRIQASSAWLAAVGRGELPMPEQPAVVIDGRCVVGVLVGVDAADDGDSRMVAVVMLDSLLR